MKKNFFLLMILKSIVIIVSHAQKLPVGYILQYSQNFSDKNSVNDFNFSSPHSWKISQEKYNYYLEFSEKSDYNPQSEYPNIIGILSKYMYSDFILEADFLQTGKEYDHRNMCVLFGLKDSSHYYYIHLASKTDENAHNIFIVNNSVRTKITAKTPEGIKWGDNKWHKVRVERNILAKTITVYFDDMSNPVMEGKDRTLIMGYIGFGSIDDSGKIDNIKIWAPAYVPGDANIFDKITISDN